MAYAELGDYDRAIENCNAAIELRRDASSYYDTRGRAYQKRGDSKLANADFATAKKLKPAE